MADDEPMTNCMVLARKILNACRVNQRKAPDGGLSMQLYDIIDVELSQLTNEQHLQIVASAPASTVYSVHNKPKVPALREMARQSLEAQVLLFAGADPDIISEFNRV